MIAVDTNILVRYIGGLRRVVFDDRHEIVHALQQLRRGGHITLEGSDEVRRAIEAYAEARADFADYLIAERAIANGCTVIACARRPRGRAPL